MICVFLLIFFFALKMIIIPIRPQCMPHSIVDHRLLELPISPDKKLIGSSGSLNGGDFRIVCRFSGMMSHHHCKFFILPVTFNKIESSRLIATSCKQI